MLEQTDLTENTYLGGLYNDLMIKSAVDIDATITIISMLEAIAHCSNSFDQSGLPESCLPGKPPMDLVAEFKQFCATSSKQPSLNNIIELRNSLDRLQSL